MVFVTLALTFVVSRLFQDWDDVRAAADQVQPVLLVVAFLAGAGGLVLTSMAWRRLLAGLGSPLGVVDAAQVFFVSQVGKYLPGSVWPYLAQARLGKDLGVPVRRSAQTGVTFVLLHLVTGLVLGLPRVLFGDELDRRFVLAVVALPLLAVLVHPAVVQRLTGLAGRAMRVEVATTPMPWRSLGVAVAWLTGAWVLYGISLALLVAPFEDLGLLSLGMLISSYALAWSVGFLGAALVVVAAPAGLGFREIALYATLAGVISPGAAALVVLMSRVIMTLADVLLAVVAATTSGITRRKAEA